MVPYRVIGNSVSDIFKAKETEINKKEKCNVKFDNKRRQHCNTDMLLWFLNFTTTPLSSSWFWSPASHVFNQLIKKIYPSDLKGKTKRKYILVYFLKQKKKKNLYKQHS